WYTPVGMRGWSEVVFRREPEGTRHVFPIDGLLRHLEAWERPRGRLRTPITDRGENHGTL
ncbi:MAG: hypothetical protein ACRELX_14190, partial [Longimicrobiales bacterium]